MRRQGIATTRMVQKRYQTEQHINPASHSPLPHTQSGPGQAYVMKNYKLFPFDMYIRIPGGAFEFHWRPKSKPEAPVIHAHVAISLAEMYTGVIRQVVVARQRFCGVCNGTGAASHEHSHTCNACRGTGRHLYLQEHDSGYAHVMNSTCEYCKVCCCNACAAYLPHSHTLCAVPHPACVYRALAQCPTRPAITVAAHALRLRRQP